jgi:DHA1 family inner membrane transport protein
MVIAAGFGYTAPNWVGAVLAAAALVLAVLSAALERRDGARGTVVAAGTPAGRQTPVHH